MPSYLGKNFVRQSMNMRAQYHMASQMGELMNILCRKGYDDVNKARGLVYNEVRGWVPGRWRA